MENINFKESQVSKSYICVKKWSIDVRPFLPSNWVYMVSIEFAVAKSLGTLKFHGYRRVCGVTAEFAMGLGGFNMKMKVHFNRIYSMSFKVLITFESALESSDPILFDYEILGN